MAPLATSVADSCTGLLDFTDNAEDGGFVFFLDLRRAVESSSSALSAIIMHWSEHPVLFIGLSEVLGMKAVTACIKQPGSQVCELRCVCLCSYACIWSCSHVDVV